MQDFDSFIRPNCSGAGITRRAVNNAKGTTKEFVSDKDLTNMFVGYFSCLHKTTGSKLAVALT